MWLIRKALSESCDIYCPFSWVRCVPVMVYFKSSTRICQNESVNYHIHYGDSDTVDDGRESKVILQIWELAVTNTLLGGLDWAIYRNFKIQAHPSWVYTPAQSNCECKGAIIFMDKGASKLPSPSLCMWDITVVRIVMNHYSTVS